jgi:hypothetical protein
LDSSIVYAEQSQTPARENQRNPKQTCARLFSINTLSLSRQRTNECEKKKMYSMGKWYIRESDIDDLFVVRQIDSTKGEINSFQ